MYEFDKRVRRAEEESKKTFDEKNMTLSFEIEEQMITLPAKFIVCDVCNGKGSHVNPAIDAHGITQEEYSTWSHEEKDDYFNGGYDVPCMTCHGRRVVPVIDEANIKDDQKELLHAVRQCEKEEREFENACRRERMMGA